MRQTMPSSACRSSGCGNFHDPRQRLHCACDDFIFAAASVCFSVWSRSPACKDGIRKRIAGPPGWKLRIVSKKKAQVCHFGIVLPEFFLKAQAHADHRRPFPESSWHSAFPAAPGEKTTLPDFSTPSGSVTMARGARYSVEPARAMACPGRQAISCTASIHHNVATLAVDPLCHGLHQAFIAAGDAVLMVAFDCFFGLAVPTDANAH